MLLEIAGYSLFQGAEVAATTIAKVAVGILGLFFGGIMLVAFFLLALALITFFSIRRGVIYRSVPKTIGAFFRLSGILLGAVVVLLLLPLALLLKASLLTFTLLAGALLLIGFLLGRTVSRVIGFRLRRYSYYLHTFDNLRSKIVRIVRYI